MAAYRHLQSNRHCCQAFPPLPATPQASARDFDDICRLACLSAELQAGQLVDAVTGSAACVAAAQAAVQQLSLRLGKAMDYISRAGPTADQAANLGWLLDSIASGIGFLSRAGAEVRLKPG